MIETRYTVEERRRAQWLLEFALRLCELQPDKGALIPLNDKVHIHVRLVATP